MSMGNRVYLMLCFYIEKAKHNCADLIERVSWYGYFQEDLHCYNNKATAEQTDLSSYVYFTAVSIQ